MRETPRMSVKSPWPSAFSADATYGELRGTSAREGWASLHRELWKHDAQMLKPSASPPHRRRHERAASAGGNETRKRSEEKERSWFLHSQKHEAAGKILRDICQGCTAVSKVCHINAVVSAWRTSYLTLHATYAKPNLFRGRSFRGLQH